MNKYFLIRPSSDPKVIGIRDGSAQAEIIRDKFVNKSHFDLYMNYYDNDDETSYWQHRLKIPEFNIELEHIQLRDRAFLTDFMCFFPNLFNGGRFLLSRRAFKVLNQFKLGNHKFFNAYVYDGRKKIDYYFLCSAGLPYEVINFDNTVFFEGSETLGKKFFQLRSGGEFEKMKEKEIFQVEKLCFREGFDDSLDYFTSIVSIPGIFISEGLKEAIEMENLTGLNILEPTEPTIELPYKI